MLWGVCVNPAHDEVAQAVRLCQSGPSSLFKVSSYFPCAGKRKDGADSHASAKKRKASEDGARGGGRGKTTKRRR
jgi:hypothetical protein